MHEIHESQISKITPGWKRLIVIGSVVMGLVFIAENTDFSFGTTETCDVVPSQRSVALADVSKIRETMLEAHNPCLERWDIIVNRLVERESHGGDGIINLPVMTPH